jgi:hypothetical protein
LLLPSKKEKGKANPDSDNGEGTEGGFSGLPHCSCLTIDYRRTPFHNDGMGCLRPYGMIEKFQLLTLVHLFIYSLIFN